MMSAPIDPLARPWRTIAAEITREQDSHKIMELVRELEQAFEEQEAGQPADRRGVTLDIRPRSRA